MSVESFKVPKKLIAALLARFKYVCTFNFMRQHIAPKMNEALIKELNKNQKLLLQFPDQNFQIDKIMAQLEKVTGCLTRGKACAPVLNAEIEEEKKEP